MNLEKVIEHKMCVLIFLYKLCKEYFSFSEELSGI